MIEFYLLLGLIYYIIQVGITATNYKNFQVDPMIIFFAILVWPIMLVADVAALMKGSKK